MPRAVRYDNLPYDLTSFVGREAEAADLRQVLSTARLLTLTGPGGVGKTRLALRLAAEVAGRGGSMSDLNALGVDGVWLARLEALTDPCLVPEALAMSLGLSEQPGRRLLDTLADFLHPQRALIVLDNCEHVVGACAQLAETLLRAVPDLTILATSRERLAVPGEVVWHVAPLEVADATRLFKERAQATMPLFRMTDGNAAPVAAICRRLDGIPLAIELAAARVSVLTVDDLARRLDDALGVLTSGTRTAPDRHSTLRAAIDWSYDLLGEDARALFAQLAVFAGGWTIDAAEAVCGRDAILDRLAGLVDRSLVTAEASASGAVRYRLLEVLRQYAGERLIDSGHGPAARDRHANFFLALAQNAEAELVGADQIGWLSRLAREHDNFRAALDWLLQRRDAEGVLGLAGALWRYWRACDHLREGRGWIEKGLELVNASGAPVLVPTRARALFAAGALALFQGDAEAARGWFANCLELYEAAGDARGRAMALIGLATPLLTHDAAQARMWLAESMATARRDGDRWLEGAALFGLAHVARSELDHEMATALYEDSLGVFRSVGEKLFVEFGLANLGYAALHQGAAGRAAGLLTELLTAALDRGSRYMAMSALFGLGLALEAEGQFAPAARVFGGVEAQFGDLHYPLMPVNRDDYAQAVARARHWLGDATFGAAWVQGRSTPFEDLATFALTAVSTTPTEHAPDQTHGLLTPREREVAILLARGHTNRRIAGELTISRRTADTHVRNILRKLECSSRSEVAAWAAGHGLLVGHAGRQANAHRR
jgi:non-specific serine/threonine protein kinase